MKKYLLALVISASLFGCGKISYQSNLDTMGKAVRAHIRYNDAENNLKTDIELLKPVSYEDIPEDQKKENEDAYICKVYLVAKSSYIGSGRVYNINDTMTCYFNKKMKFLRWDKKDN